ncbi:MAG: TetR/AcrR family transcriptional regulator [Oscillospiraceae bacterium]
MKREEKALSSRRRILAAATAEFGAKSYDSASLNSICNENEISKGLIYHYFGNKDDLYLCCVRDCFEKFTAFLQEEDYDFSDFQRGMNQYMERRILFFRSFPSLGRLFFYTVLQPPLHLSEQLRQLRVDFDAQCRNYYKTGLSHLCLREGVTEETALQYFSMFQEMFNSNFQRNMGENNDLNSLMQEHEAQLSQLLNLMLYGIAKENQPL